MSLIAIDGHPMVIFGGAGREGSTSITSAVSTLLDAANEAIIMIGQVITEDGQSHTIDTTGSSSIGWRSAAVTFIDAGTTVKVGLAAVDTAAGPAPRAVNVANVITFDVSKTLAAGGIAANAWQENVPDAGTKTIANGDLVAMAVQMTARGGSDAVNVTCEASLLSGPLRPTVTNFVGGSYTAATAIPNAVITFSDGTLGFFFGSVVFSTTATALGFNSSSSPNEFGNFFQAPFPMSIYGIASGHSIASGSSNFDMVLYSDPMGTPVAQRTLSVDANTLGSVSGGRWCTYLFSSPHQVAPNQPIGLVLKPTSANNVTINSTIFNVANHQKSLPFGLNGYAISRSGGAGAFAQVNSGKERYGMSVIAGAFDTGGMPASRMMLGM